MGVPFLLCFPGQASEELIEKEAWPSRPKAKAL